MEREDASALAIRFAWSLVLPIACVTILAVLYVAPWIAPADPTRPQIDAAFIAGAGIQCHPDSLQHVQYVIAVLLPVFLFMAAWPFRLRLSGAWMIPPAAAAQGALLLYAGAMWTGQFHRIGKGQYPVWQGVFFSLPVTLILLGALACGYGWIERRRREGAALPRLPDQFKFGSQRARRGVILAAGLLTLLGLLPSLNFDNTVDYAHGKIPSQGINSYHIPVIVDEFAAVVNGRSIAVDFFPQYQNLMPYLLEPYFKLVGMHVGTFSVAMIALGLCGLMMIFFVFREILPGWELLLYLPFLGLAFTPQIFDSPGFYVSPFTAFALAPLRYFGGWATFFIFSWYLRKPRNSRMAVLFMAGTLAAINNLDFGIGALAAAVAGVLVTSPSGWIPDRHWAARTFGLLIGVVAVTAGIYFGYVRLRSGEWPAIGTSLLFQRAFIFYGFFLSPMPAFGFHHVIYFLFMASIWKGIVELSRSSPLSTAERHLGGLLVYSGIFGFGVSTYFVAESHPHNLIVSYPAAGVSLMLLVYAHFREGLAPLWTWKRAIPTFLLALGYLAAAISLRNVPTPWGQVERLCHLNSSLPTRQQRALNLIETTAAHGEEVAISYPYGHLLAEQAGVRNLFPFATPDVSILLKDEVVLAARVLDQHHIRRFYGYCSPELEQELILRGFQKKLTLEPYPIMQYWERP